MKRTPLKRKTQLRQVSEKRRIENADRERTRRIVAKRSGGLCEGRALIATVDPVAASACKKRAVDLHEKRKRSRGGSITDPANILHLCRSCHEFTEREPAAATRAGMLIPSWT